MSTWLVRAGGRGEYLDCFLEKRMVALGDPLVGELSGSVTVDDLVRLYGAKYPERTDHARLLLAHQAHKFVSGIGIGDGVVTYEPTLRLYIEGRVTSQYCWNPSAIPDRPHVRAVTWTHQVARDQLAKHARNSLGSVHALFEVPTEAVAALREVRRLLTPLPPKEQRRKGHPPHEPYLA